MAKSIFEILDDLNTETSVPEVKDSKGKILRKNFGVVSHTIPRDFLPTSEQFEDEEKLLEWFQDSGNLHAGLQSAVQKRLIDLRAIFKSMGKDDEWTEEFGQDRLNNAEWKIVSRPKVGTNVKALEKAKLDAGREMAQAMRNAGLPDEMILSALKPVYGDDGANEIMNSLT